MTDTKTRALTFGDMAVDWDSVARKAMAEGSQLLAACPVVLTGGDTIARPMFTARTGRQHEKTVLLDELGFDVDVPVSAWATQGKAKRVVGSKAREIASCYDSIIAKAAIDAAETGSNATPDLCGYDFLLTRSTEMGPTHLAYGVKHITLNAEDADRAGLGRGTGVAIRMSEVDGMCLFATGMPEVRFLGDLSEDRPAVLPRMRSRVDLYGAFVSLHHAASVMVDLSWS